MSGISIYESYCISYKYPVWSCVGVIQGSCVGSYRDLVWGSYRIIYWLWILFSLIVVLDLDCSEIYKNTNDIYCVYLTGIFGGVLQGSCVRFYWCLVVGSYRIICWFAFYYLWLWCLEMDCSEIYADCFCIVKHTYQEMSGISIYESYCISYKYPVWSWVGSYGDLVAESYRDIGGVLQGSWVGSYGDLWWGPMGIFGGVLQDNLRIVGFIFS